MDSGIPGAEVPAGRVTRATRGKRTMATSQFPFGTGINPRGLCG